VSFNRFKNTKAEKNLEDLINKTIHIFLRLHEKLHNLFCFTERTQTHAEIRPTGAQTLPIPHHPHT
jgi:hypothetical protein